jgi:alpha-beta hydrolase superfamily lysophospholipase
VSMEPQVEALKDHFERMMAMRSAAVAFERFEPASTTSAGLRLHLDVIEVERASATLVFVHGTAVYGLVYGDLLAAVADGGCNVVSVDLRGHGRSEGRPGHYTMPELVDDARAAVEYARRRFGGPVVAAGSSQGGLVALYLAATDAPVSGVICHNAADLADPGNLRRMGKSPLLALPRLALLAAGRLWPHTEIAIRRYFDLLVPGPSKVKDRLAADPFTIKVISLGALASLSSAPLAKPVEKITTPVLIVHGGRDTLFPLAFTEALFARLTCDKKLLLYPERDHFVFTEQVGAVVPDLLAWIRHVGSSSTDLARGRL